MLSTIDLLLIIIYYYSIAINQTMNYLQMLQADIERLQAQCKPQLMTVRYTKLPTTINRPRKSVKF